MLRALLWKEWREQRGIAFAGAAVAIAIPLLVIIIASSSGEWSDLSPVAEIVPFLFGMVVWPLFAALAGATANAESASPGSAGFLFSRPVSRVALWLVKVVIAAVAIVFVVTLSFYVALQVDVRVGGWGFSFPFSSDPFSWPPDDVVRSMAIGSLYLSFSGAVFLSTFVRRPVAAAFGAIGLAAAVEFAALFVAGLLSSSGLSGAGAFVETLSIGLAATLMLGSLHVFRIGGQSGGDGAGRHAQRACAGIFLSIPLIVALAGFTSTRIVPGAVRATLVLTVPGTDTSIFSFQRSSFSGSGLWAVEPGRDPRRLTSRLAAAVTIGRNGEWLFYTSRSNLLGMRSSRCELRAVRVDGVNDHVLTTIPRQRDCYLSGRLSPDQQRIAVRVSKGDGRSLLLIVDTIDGGSRYVDVGPIAEDYWSFASDWVSGRSLLLYSNSESSRGYWLVDPDSGRLDRLYTPAAENISFSLLATSNLYAMVYEREQRDRSFPAADDVPAWQGGKLIDLVDRSAREIEPLCGGESRIAGAFEGESDELYFTCRPRLPRRWEWDSTDFDALERGSILRRDLVSGEETVIAELDGYVESFEPSPNASRFLVRLANRRDTPLVVPADRYLSFSDRQLAYRYALVGADGSVRYLDIGRDWSVAEWFGDDRIVLLGLVGSYGARDYAYLDIADDNALSLRSLYSAIGGY